MIPEVYEDDVDRNYALLVEMLIALKETLRCDGLPHVKDLQAILLDIQFHLCFGKRSDDLRI